MEYKQKARYLVVLVPESIQGDKLLKLIAKIEKASKLNVEVFDHGQWTAE